jgi:Ribosomal protein L7/L12 C-terminal domain
MDFFNPSPLVLVGWTALVFLAGYAFGKLRIRRDNDLTGPPSDIGQRHMSARPDNPNQPDGRSPKLPDALADWANLDPQTEAAINDAMARGNKIEAIKIVREATGLGLKESKEAVDRLDFSAKG